MDELARFVLSSEILLWGLLGGGIIAVFLGFGLIDTQRRIVESAGCVIVLVGTGVILTVFISWLVAVVAQARYDLPDPPTWPPLEATLDVSPATGTFTETEEIILSARLTNRSDTTVQLGGLGLTMSEGIVAESLRATPAITQSVEGGHLLWLAGVTIPPGEAWDFSIPVQLATYGNRQGAAYAVISVPRTYQRAHWDFARLQPEQTPTTETELQTETVSTPINWTVLRR